MRLKYCPRFIKYLAMACSSGGESKDEFWKMVHLSTDHLPKEKPRYVMGVGFAEDILVCVALGADMFDCVYPTRTAVSMGFNKSPLLGVSVNIRSRRPLLAITTP